ncbi:peptidoglycan binding protein CsiV, partial [Porticoccaceae bacterium]|nr:peptidoglycan binding protein CsiV [Porticoccaceae bacterium]
NGYNLQSVTPLFNSIQLSPINDNLELQNTGYPIEAIWPIKQSKRIQEEEVYYIDHPQMGALVSIKAYEPLPINLPPLQPDITEEQVLDASN